MRDPDDDAAASKVWAVYVSEAEKYDRSLVESWKSDMEGMLIFAGLFSASLTAFIIENYKMLIPDSGDSTVQLLAQISQPACCGCQREHIPGPTTHAFFRADDVPRIQCTVVHQPWAQFDLCTYCDAPGTMRPRLFAQGRQRSALVIRARVFSFLYYGLKSFNMYTVVDIMPLRAMW
ncbi:hypothetical protein B0H16DRAFT_550509 [Mycena metata]|uniref:DUF6535 domain-containing protein n=1 Tax=Mycena metata TaxID=1033252 RepID=A0AAD7MEG0_9AGAR|nr:hypothetical protein B0H16DRAFT_550509 [Mycena metata]